MERIMFGFELFDVSIGFVAALVVVNLFPKTALVGGWLIKTAKAGYSWVKGKVTQ